MSPHYPKSLSASPRPPKVAPELVIRDIWRSWGAPSAAAGWDRPTTEDFRPRVTWWIRGRLASLPLPLPARRTTNPSLGVSGPARGARCPDRPGRAAPHADAGADLSAPAERPGRAPCAWGCRGGGRSPPLGDREPGDVTLGTRRRFRWITAAFQHLQVIRGLLVHEYSRWTESRTRRRGALVLGVYRRRAGDAVDVRQGQVVRRTGHRRAGS